MAVVGGMGGVKFAAVKRPRSMARRSSLRFDREATRDQKSDQRWSLWVWVKMEADAAAEAGLSGFVNGEKIGIQWTVRRLIARRLAGLMAREKAMKVCRSSTSKTRSR